MRARVRVRLRLRQEGERGVPPKEGERKGEEGTEGVKKPFPDGINRHNRSENTIVMFLDFFWDFCF